MLSQVYSRHDLATMSQIHSRLSTKQENIPGSIFEDDVQFQALSSVSRVEHDFQESLPGHHRADTSRNQRGARTFAKPSMAGWW